MGIKGKYRGFFWIRALLVATVACCLVWVTGHGSWRYPIVAIGGLTAAAAGVLTFGDIGGAGLDWARWIQARRERRFAPGSRLPPERTYKTLGMVTVTGGLLLIIVGVLGYIRTIAR
jgi:hypothetical protein